MELNVVAQRYAGALSALSAGDAVGIEKINADLNLLNTALRASDSIRVFFEAPGVPAHLKKEKAAAVFSKKIDKRVLNLFLVLIDKGRVSILQDVQESFQTLCDQAMGYVQVSVATARDFSTAEEIKEKVAKTIDAQKSKFGLESAGKKKLQYIIHQTTDASMIGGFTLRVGDYLLDASVREYLKKWRQNVKLSKPDKGSAWS